MPSKTDRSEGHDPIEKSELLRRTRLDLIETDRRLQEVLQSRSWEVTVPARRLGRRYPWVGRVLVRLFRVAHLLASGKLFERIRIRRVQRSRNAGSQRVRPPFPEPSRKPSDLPPPQPSPGGQIILIVSDSIPRPDRHAGGRSVQAFIDAFRLEGWGIVFAPFDCREAGTYTTAMTEAGVLVIDSRVGGGLTAWLAVHGRTLDQVMLMYPEPADAVLDAVLRYTDARLSYYGHDLHFVRTRLRAMVEHDSELAEIAERMLTVERRIWRTVDVVLYPAENEAETVRRMVPDVNARAVPAWAFDSFPEPHPPPHGANLLFVGGFNHAPNADGIIWFVHEVMPLVAAANSAAKLVIVGGDPPPALQALAGPHIEVTGYVDDEALGALYDRTRVAVAPLRFGAGVKGKVVEAMWRGVPVVTTAIGAEGMPDVGEVLIVRDDPKSFAESVKTLLKNDTFWATQARRQTDYVRDRFDYATLRRHLVSGVSGLTGSGGRGLV